MKNILIALVLLSAALLSAGVVQQSYDIPAPVVMQDGQWSHVSLEGGAVLTDPGKPEIPSWPVELLLPPGESIVSVDINWGESVNLGDGFNVYPQQTPVPISHKETANFTGPDQAVYAANEIWPYNDRTEAITQYLRGHSIGLMQLWPVRYNPVSGELSYYTSATVTVNTTSSQEAQRAYTHHRGDQNTISRVEMAVDNPEAVMQYPQQTRDRIDGHLMVIITGENQVSYFDDFVDFKTRQGFNPLVMTIEDINANYTGVDEQDRIRYFIIDCYDNQNTEYVILGGDVEIVPFRGLYINAGGTEDSSMPGDLYFSNLDRVGTGAGPDWNVDNDARWGEPGEADYYPELAIGRISANTSAQFDAMLNKQIMYQMSPVVDDCETALMVGEELNDNPQTNGGDYKDDIITGGYHNGYTTVGIPTNFTVGTMYERDGYWSRNDLQAQMNAGLNLLNHLGHSNTDYNMKFSNSHITNNNLTSNGVNHSFFLIFSQGCYSSSFDYTDAISELFTTIDNGCFCYVGNSRYGWYSPGATSSSSQFLDRHFFNAIFGDGITRVGDANADSKNEAAVYCNADAYMRWSVYEVNVLGDPSVDLWTAEPVALTPNYDSTLPITASLLPIAAGAPNALVCVSRNGEQIASALTDDNGNTIINFSEPFTELGTLDVYITAHDYLIHTGEVQLIAADQPFVTIESWSVNAGGDDQIEFGESGTLTLNLSNIGQQPSDAISINLSSDSDYIDFTDGSEDIAALAAGESTTLEAAFAFDIDGNVPDMEEIAINVAMSDGSYTWTPQIIFTALAPELALGDIIVDDDNGCLDPGETVDVQVYLVNDGSADLHDINISFTSSDPFVTVNQGTAFIDVLDANDEEPMTFNVTVSNDVELGYMASFTLDAEGEYDIDLYDTVVLVVGNITEDFESGDFTSFDWEMSGAADWTIDNNAYEGSFCARSGSIGSDQSTTLYLSINVMQNSEIGFMVKASCEDDPADNYDFLLFEIDGQEQGRWDGETSWTYVNYPVESGEHTFSWTYSKDVYVDSGQDCAWIDVVEFPAFVGDVLSVFFLSPSELNFGVVPVGESQSRNFSIFNMGEATLFGSIDVPEGFTLDSPTATRKGAGSNRINSAERTVAYTVEPSEFAQYTLTFAPQEEGNYSTNIVITSNDPYHAANALSVIASTSVGAEEDPQKYVDALLGNHPNPFNPTTTVALSVAADHTPVRVDIYNVRGQKVATLHDGELDAGLHNLVWHGVDANENSVGSGVYFVRSSIGEKTFMRKMLMLK